MIYIIKSYGVFRSRLPSLGHYFRMVSLDAAYADMFQVSIQEMLIENPPKIVYETSFDAEIGVILIVGAQGAFVENGTVD